ncbi:MAG: nucleotidyltransferase family protein [Synergistetes bacterium]|nr:nucleotidyltransferase family protein [Synergistota bacterium]
MEDVKFPREGIILCGGFGKRLRSVVRDVPKPMAEVGGKPFLSYILDYLGMCGLEKVILAVGYKREAIQGYFGERYGGIGILYSVEEYPLDTGGAIRQALDFAEGEEVFVFNGDTLFELSLLRFFQLHADSGADVSIALRWMEDTSRYGRIDVLESGRVISFSEKGGRGKGYVNAGVYILPKNVFEGYPVGDVFSFEKDFLQVFYPRLRLFGFGFDSYFIDIGVPEDYNRARLELARQRGGCYGRDTYC